jgi:hypothetical protein
MSNWQLVVAVVCVYGLLAFIADRVGRQDRYGLGPPALDGVMMIMGWPLDAAKGSWLPVRVVASVVFVPWMVFVFALYMPVTLSAIVCSLAVYVFEDTK